MRATLWIAASGLLLAATSAHAGPGLGYAHDDTVYPDDAADAQAAPPAEGASGRGDMQSHVIAVRVGDRVELLVTGRRADGAAGEMDHAGDAPDGDGSAR